MPENPLVSVVMPVHNGAEFLQESIESALGQDYAPLELVVVDDGSTDASPAILDRFAGRISLIRQNNAGAAAARNAGIRASRGTYLAFLDADDLWSPHKLRAQVHYLRTHPEIRLVCSRWRVWQEGEEHEPMTATDELGERVDAEHHGWIYNELLMDCVVHTTTVLMHRELFEEVGPFDEGLRRGQDYDYWLRISRVTPIHRLSAALSIYRLHTSNSTWRPLETNFACVVLERALRRWGRTGPDGRVTPASRMNRRLADLWFSFGYQHWESGSRAVAARAFTRSIAAWPWRPKPWLLALASLLTPARTHA